MGEVIAATEFKARCLELMDVVAARRISYLVTKRGVLVAKLVPVDEPGASPIGFLRGTAVEHGDIVTADAVAWPAGDDPLDLP
jgi:prevent-host-death family protein